MALLDVDEATERFKKKLEEGYFDDKGLSDEEIQTMMKALVDADKESEDDYEPPDDEYDDGYKDGYKAMQDKINAAIAEIEGKYRVILKGTPKDYWAVRWNDCLDEVLQIIDKYKAESEEV